MSSKAQPGLSTKSKKAAELYTVADNYRVRQQYSEAISLLEQAIDKDKDFYEAYYRLGITYFSMKDYQKALITFEKGVSLTNDPQKQKVFWFDMGEAYFASMKLDQAEESINKFLAVEKTNKKKLDRANRLLTSIAYAKESLKTAAAYKQRVLSDTVNSFYMQYFPVLTADQRELIFTRRNGPGPQDDEDLVVSRKDAAGRWTTPVSISGKINSTLNEGTCAVSADGRKIIFTSCVGRDGLGSCDLYQSEKLGSEWTEPQNLGKAVNTADWESQPSLSADGRTLYFVSERNGGLGRRDIWYTTLNEKGEWSQARNLGKPINSVYDELSPFIHANNSTLYFASNGLVGFGGYDLFSAEKDSANKWSEPRNLGTPINTYEDQFSFFITADGKKGYYSHEEKGQGNTRSKIIEIEIPEDKRVRRTSNYVHGTVTDKDTGKPLKAKIELIDIDRNDVQSLVYSDSLTGEYLIVLTQGSEYALYINKVSYLFQNVNFNYSEVKNFEPITLDIRLEKIREGSVAILKNIFFDHDKYVLRDKSITELQKVKRFMEDNPAVRVEISGHTDNTGSLSYNQQLSEKRALAVLQFLTDNAIDKSRVVAKGYGATRPIADNSTDEGKAANRRIEFRLIH